MIFQCVRYGSQVVKYLSHNEQDRLQMPNPMVTVQYCTVYLFFYLIVNL